MTPQEMFDAADDIICPICGAGIEDECDISKHGGSVIDQNKLNDAIEYLDRSGKRDLANVVRGLMAQVELSSSPEKIIEERAAFEKYYSEDGLWPKAIERSHSGGYRLMQAQAAWDIWQVRASLDGGK